MYWGGILMGAKLETSITLFNYSASQIHQQYINLNSTKSQLPYVIPLYVSREC